jgi:hypothetical protein
MRLAAIPLALMIGAILSPVYSQNLEPKNGEKGTSAGQNPPGVTPETMAKEKAARASTSTNSSDAMKAPTTATKNKGP